MPRVVNIVCFNFLTYLFPKRSTSYFLLAIRQCNAVVVVEICTHCGPIILNVIIKFNEVSKSLPSLDSLLVISSRFVRIKKFL